MDVFCPRKADVDMKAFEALPREVTSRRVFQGSAQWILPKKFGLSSTLWNPLEWHYFSKPFHTWWARGYLFVGGAIMYKWGASFMAHKKRKPEVEWNNGKLGHLRKQ
eukprot:NODE_3224_length_440_cov_36.495208_g3174_i0.p1 GENE.NODE_3224_length_440_cov_36.495208_g3174_i0~~NODE_3224_length_440_cov_36.495208_g3174_i0.p1  ORF type:complete len:107 (+),score=19.94 NODE_3224_length_440_cov_36.495208_g3174_i0:57-377(+)